MPWSLTGRPHCTKLDNRPQRKIRCDLEFNPPLRASSNTPESCYSVNGTYPEVKEDPRDSGAGIWAKSLLVCLNSPRLRKICKCSFRPGVHIFTVAYWHLECLHWRLVSFRACFHSLHPFSLCHSSSAYSSHLLPFSMKSIISVEFHLSVVFPPRLNIEFS